MNHSTINSLFVFLTAVISHPVMAAEQSLQDRIPERWQDLYESGEFEGVEYRLLKPIDYDPSKSYPLVLTLHGGDDEEHERSGDIRPLRVWNEILTQETLRRKHPCFVVAPISRTMWADADSDVELYPYTDADAIAALPAKVRRYYPAANRMNQTKAAQKGVLGTLFKFIDTELAREYNINAERVYCIGHSKGGIGTFDAIYQNPDRFAAAIPSAGSFHALHDITRIKDIAIWAFHGENDEVLDCMLSQHAFDRMKRVGGNMKLTKLSVPGHYYPQIVFDYTGDEEDQRRSVTFYASEKCDRTENVWDWLFAQKRERDE